MVMTECRSGRTGICRRTETVSNNSKYISVIASHVETGSVAQTVAQLDRSLIGRVVVTSKAIIRFNRVIINIKTVLYDLFRNAEWQRTWNSFHQETN